MKKIISIVFVLNILLSFTIPIHAKKYSSTQDAIKDANEFLKILGVNDYYKSEIEVTKKINEKNEIVKLKINDELAKSGNEDFNCKPVFVYGDAYEASVKVTSSGKNVYVTGANGEKIYRALGFARDGSTFPNPAFPSGVDNLGVYAPNKKWVKEPWEPGEDKKLQTENG